MNIKNTRFIQWIIFILILPITLLYFSDKYSLFSPGFQKRAENKRVAIENWRTENDIEVFFVATKGVPIVDMQVIFDAGSSRDEEKFGLASFCASSLDKGANELTADQIASNLENIGAIYGSSVDRDKATFSLRSLSDLTVLDPAVKLFANIITKPNFPDPNIQILKNQTLKALQRSLQQPSVIAQKAFFETIYANHPYGHIVLGSPSTISAMSKADLVQFQQQYYVAQNAVIAIVGGLTSEEAKTLSNLIAKDIPSGNKAEPIPEVPPLTQATEKNLPLAIEQAHILMGQPCSIENDPDYFPLLIGNQTLGGGALTSRLFKEIREERGLVYSVSSYFVEWQRPGPFMINLQTKNEQAPEALMLLRKTLSQFITEGITENELSESKETIIRSFPLEIDTNAKLIQVVSRLGFYKFPLDYLDTYVEQVSDVTREQVKKAFQKRLDPEKMSLIIVGATKSGS